MSDESVCRTCVYGFPASDGDHSCCIMRKPTSAVVVRCEGYAERWNERRQPRQMGLLDT